jgi:NAD(P)H-dependent FMN reductase
MYPNFVSSEAVLASENLIFTQHANDLEAYNASLHPFIRNSVASMDFGPVLLNQRQNKNNDKGPVRKTTETFQLATAFLFQSPIQNFGITPGNVKESPAFLIDLLKRVPTTWDETAFIEGYPGKYCVLARRHHDQWYFVGINAEKQVKKITLKVSQRQSPELKLYSDKPTREAQLQMVRTNKKGEITVEIQPGGAFIITN